MEDLVRFGSVLNFSSFFAYMQLKVLICMLTYSRKNNIIYNVPHEFPGSSVGRACDC